LNDPFELLAPKSVKLRLRQAMGELKSQFDDTNGLLCFSADWTDPVLWSHYGDKHRGICLGFDVERRILHDVSYRSSRIVEDVSGRTIDAEITNLLLETKFESWRYERESRVLVPLEAASQEGDLHFIYFDNELRLAEVILGPLCRITARRVRKLVDQHQDGVVTIKSRLAYKTFSVVPMESTVPILSDT
jgi:hypothetical protein